MLVGPMKKKVITTGVVAAVVPIVILGIIGFFVIRNYNSTVADLKKQSSVVEKYVLKEDAIANHTITESDIEIRGVKSDSAPDDSYSEVNKDELIGKVLKVNAKANTILSKSMLFDDDKMPTADLRLQEFNMITLPSDLVENDYIDVRVRFPSGEDYSVLIGKKIEKYSNDTIFMKLTEDEILTIGSAIIEAYILDGTKLYANKYVDPANQLFAYNKVDYVARYSGAVEALISDIREEKVNEYISKNPTATEAEINTYASSLNVSVNDISVTEISNSIGLSESETNEIKNALKSNNEGVLSNYRSKILVTEKKNKMTYPVKENVLNIIKSNPNILEEIKANFNEDIILAQRLGMPSTTIDEENEYDQRVKESLVKEIELQKEERVAYLKSLLSQ